MHAVTGSRKLVTSLLKNKSAFVSLLVLIVIMCSALCSSMDLTPWSRSAEPRTTVCTHRCGNRVDLGHTLSEMTLLGGTFLVAYLRRTYLPARWRHLGAHSGAIGICLGLVAGYYGGRTDSIIMRLTDLQYAIPFLVLALAVMAVLGSSLRNVILVLGLRAGSTTPELSGRKSLPFGSKSSSKRRARSARPMCDS